MHCSQRAVSRKRGRNSSDTEQVTASLALVRALPMPRLREAATTLCASSADTLQVF